MCGLCISLTLLLALVRDLDPDDRYDIPWHRQESDGQMHDFSALLILINVVPFVVAVVGCVSVVFFHRHTIKKHVTRHAVLLRAKTRVLPRRLSLAPQHRIRMQHVHRRRPRPAHDVRPLSRSAALDARTSGPSCSAGPS